MNNIKFKKSLMAAAAGAVLATVGMSAANANSLLFPYYNFDGAGNLSYLSLQTSSGIPTTGGSAPIHFVYFGAPTGGTYKADTFCAHQQDGVGSMTPNDLVNMLVQSNPATPSDPASGNLFGDKSTTFSLTLPKAAGFMVVSNLTDSAGTAAASTYGYTSSNQDLTGEMVVVNASPNMVFGYSGLTNNNTTEGNFDNITATSYNLSWYPSSAMTTQWYALAVGNQTASVATPAAWSASATLNVANVYDRDENAFSQNVQANVGCGTTLTLGAPADATGAQLVTAANLNAITNGGLIETNANGNTVALNNASTSGIVMYKVELPQFVQNANAYFTLMRNTDGLGTLGF
ncbi:hypothetical protein [Thiomonas sp.]